MNKALSVEGIDGAGKGYWVKWLVEFLRNQGQTVTVTREPGGTPLAEKIRALLLNEPMDVETEALLFTAARRDHLVTVIEPALARGEWVIADRFETSSRAYQCGGRGLPVPQFDILDTWIGGVRPDTTILFDVPTDVTAARMNGRVLDRFELEQRDFHDRVRSTYLEVAHKNPDRFVIIDANRPIEAIQIELEAVIRNRFGFTS